MFHGFVCCVFLCPFLCSVCVFLCSCVVFVCVLSAFLFVSGVCFSTLILSWTDTRPVVDNIKVAKCLVSEHNCNICCSDDVEQNTITLRLHWGPTANGNLSL